MLRCKDNSIYTGITTDIKRRLDEHFSKDKKCAKYTFSHEALKVECIWKCDTRAHASKLEYQIKALTKVKKEELIKNSGKLDEIFGKKLDSSNYIVSY
jgi:putative endonuclease